MKTAFFEQPQPSPGEHTPSMSPRAWAGAMLGVLLLALLMRGVFVLEIRDLGFFNVLLSDALVYDQRAQGIVEGDWLGPADFIHAPLYPVALAVVRLIGFDSLLAPRILQALLGAIGCVLLMEATRRALPRHGARDGIALTAGLLLALYPPAIFFDGLIQKTSMVLFLSTLLLWLLLVARDKRTARWWLACGAALGLLTLVRQNALALIPLLLAFAWLAGDAVPRRQRAVNIAVAALGLAMVLAPWVVRHKIVLGEYFLSTPNMGQNFAMGNHPEATGTYLPAQRGRATGEAEHAVWKRAAEKALGRELTAAEVSDYHMDASLAYIKANPSQWLALSGRKLLMVFGAYELPDTEDFYLYKERSSVLRIGDALFHFGVLGPLAVGGIVLTLRHWRRLWLLHGWLIVNAIAIAAFVVFARYRAPILPVMIMFAAVALVQGAILLRGGQWRGLAVPAVCVLCAAVIVNWPIHSPRTTHAFSYVNHAVALAEAGRHDEAMVELDKAHALEPGDVDAHWIRGSVLFDLRQFDEALEHYHAALAGDPLFGGAHRGIGSVHLAAGNVNDAAEHFRRALDLDPRDHIAMSKLAVVHATRGQPLEALALLERAVAIEPNDPEVHLNIGSAHVALRQFDEAVDAYERALALRPQYVDALANLAQVESARGNSERAIAHMRRLLELQPQNRQVLFMLISSLMQANRASEAIILLERRIDRGEADLQPLLDAVREQAGQ